jgi:hypothetical protein
MVQQCGSLSCAAVAARLPQIPYFVDFGARRHHIPAAANHCCHIERHSFMSFKSFSSGQVAPSKDSAAEKAKAAPVAGQPAIQPDKSPAEPVATPKS